MAFEWLLPLVAACARPYLVPQVGGVGANWEIAPLRRARGHIVLHLRLRCLPQGMPTVLRTLTCMPEILAHIYMIYGICILTDPRTAPRSGGSTVTFQGGLCVKWMSHWYMPDRKLYQSIGIPRLNKIVQATTPLYVAN